MGRPPHRCLGVNGKHCSALITKGSRCKACRNQLYGSTWTQQSKQARALHPYCAWCGTTRDLALDHIEGGSLKQGTQVLCRSCNNKKAAGHEPPRNFS